MNKFSYIKNISNGIGTILLYKQIGNSVSKKGEIIYGISGSDFAAELQYLQTKCSVINVRINSVGGSVLDGYSIVSAILNSSIPVDTYVDGLAASIAGVIAMAGRKCHIMDYGTLMVHNPHGGEDKEVLGLVKATLVTILSNRTKKTAEEISAMMDKETWLNAKEAKESGMVDEIISSGKKVKINTAESLYNVALIYNQLINKSMDKVTNVLKLKNEASEAEIVAAIEAKDTELTALKNELTALKEEKRLREEAEKTALKNKATELVNKAVTEGKIKDSEKEATILNASKDQGAFDFVSNFLSKIPSGKQSQKPFNVSNVKEEKAEDRSTWNYNDWEQKDEAGLKQMYIENRVQFDELVKTRKVKK